MNTNHMQWLVPLRVIQCPCWLVIALNTRLRLLWIWMCNTIEIFMGSSSSRLDWAPLPTIKLDLIHDPPCPQDWCCIILPSDFTHWIHLDLCFYFCTNQEQLEISEKGRSLEGTFSSNSVAMEIKIWFQTGDYKAFIKKGGLIKMNMVQKCCPVWIILHTL